MPHFTVTLQCDDRPHIVGGQSVAAQKRRLQKLGGESGEVVSGVASGVVSRVACGVASGVVSGVANAAVRRGLLVSAPRVRDSGDAKTIWSEAVSCNRL